MEFGIGLGSKRLCLTLRHAVLHIDWQGKARQGKARQGKARQGKARQLDVFPCLNLLYSCLNLKGSGVC